MRIRRRPLDRDELDHETLWTLTGLGAAAMGWFYLSRLAAIGYQCPFWVLTGRPCLTCGGSRALWALVALRPAEALASNPLVTLAALAWLAYLPYGAWAAVGGRRRRRIRLEWTPKDWRRVRWALALAVGLNWAWLWWFAARSG